MSMSRYRIGHTTITWAPYFEPEPAVPAIAELGFEGLETFGLVLEEYERNRGGFGRVLEEHGIGLASAYLFSPLIDPATATDDIERNVYWAGLTKELGGDVVVLGTTDRVKHRYTVDEYRGMAATLREIGARCLDMGVKACFHPHTGTAVETREEIDTLLGLIDPDVVFFAPDTGQIQKGGSDAVAVVEDYLPLVKHVHLKDFRGGEVRFEPDGSEIDETGFLNYVPLGDGVVDIPAVLALLDGAGYDGWVNVELDANEQAPRDGREAAARSKHYLESVLGEQIGERQGAGS
jgi:inosose dehydratase